MLKFFVKALGFLAALVLSGAACAVSMGSINVTTALGEPLKAEIDLSDVGKGEKKDMSVRLATPEAFKDAGLDYPGNLPKLKFQIATRASGEPYLAVTSAQPVNEPFVNLLVELTWPSGKLLREYTFLLDPPGFKPEQPKVEQVQPVLSKAAEPPVPSVAASEPAPAPAAAPVPAKEEPLPMRAAAPMAEKTPAAKPAATASNVASGPIKVKHGDTLSKIASETKPPEVSLERMLVAMYRTNEDAFDGNNMNRLKTGKILRIPEEGDLSKLGQAEAVKEIRAQVADWHAYRLRLAAASSSTEEQAPRQETSGKISTTVADKAPPAKESAKEVVRLSKGEAPGDKTAAGGNAKALQDKLHTMQEEAIARDKMLKDSNERIAVLEKNIKEMQRLLELKGQPVPPAKPADSKAVEVKPLPAAPEVAKPAPVAAPAMAPASAVAPAKPVKKPAMKPVVTPPSMLDEILAEPLYLAGGAAALLALGGTGFMLARRRGKGGKAGAGAVESDSAATHIAEPVAPSPETGDFTHAVAAQSGTEEPDDVDPISEADLFLNFGRDVQAEDILKDALKKNPGNQQVRLKLLSIYANRKDIKTFSVVAQQVQESGDAAAWAQAAEMGHKLEPGNPMYGGDDSAAASEISPEEATVTQSASSLDFDLGLGTPETAATSELDVPVDVTTDTSTGLDFDLGMGVPEEPATVAADAVTPDEAVQDETSDTSSVMDFDLGLGEAETAAAAEPEVVASSDTLNAEGSKAQEEPLDFDITAEHRDLSAEAPEQAGKPMPSVDDLVFDVTATHPAPVAMMEKTAEPEAPAETEEAMAFTLDLPTSEEPAAAEKAEPAKEVALDLSEISLELSAPTPAPAPEEEAKDARWHDVATKLDLARAYQEMGDASGAKEILEEVLNEGDEQQRAAANAMMQQLSV